MSDEVLKARADLGCYRIWIGSESGSQRILDAMERGVTVEQVQWLTLLFAQSGVGPNLQILHSRAEGDAPA